MSYLFPHPMQINGEAALTSTPWTIISEDTISSSEEVEDGEEEEAPVEASSEQSEPETASEDEGVESPPPAGEESEEGTAKLPDSGGQLEEGETTHHIPDRHTEGEL